MSFISQLITSKATPGGVHSPITSTPASSTAAAGVHHAPGLPPGFTGAGFAGIGATGFGGIGGIGASPAGGIGSATRLPMRTNLGLPMSLQMPLTFPTGAPATTNSSTSSSTSSSTTTATPMIPNMRRTTSKEPQPSSSAPMASTPAATSGTTTTSSNNNNTSTAASTASASWNDAQKMQDFFLHIKDPEQFVQAENKLINIRDLMARTASPLERFESAQEPKDFSKKSSGADDDDGSSTASTSTSASSSANASPASPATSVAATAASVRTDSSKSHSALTDMLAARSGRAATPMKPTASREQSNQDDNDSPVPPQGDARGNMLAEMLAKRGGGGGNKQPEPPTKSVETPKPKPKTTAAAGDMRGNMLAEMLAKRGGGGPQPAPPAKPVETPKPKAPAGDARGNMLAEMLAKRGGGGGSPIPSTPTKSASPAKTSEKSNPLAAMLAKRMSPQTPSADKRSEKVSSNPLAAMLAKRVAPPPAAASSAESESAAAGNPQESQASQQQTTTGAASQPVALRDDPKYAQYFKMLKIGHPAPVVKHRMQRDGVDPAVLDLDPSKPVPSTLPGQSSEDAEAERAFQAQLAEYNEKVGKYTQMLKVGLPRPVVEHKMRMEGVEPSWLDGPPTKKAPAAPAVAAAPTEAEIAAHREKYAKYFAMLRVGLPRGAVAHKMQMAGIDPKELDGPHPVAAPTAATGAKDSPSAGKTLKRTNSIRKKIHWEVKTPATHKRTGSRDSLWTFPMADDELMGEIQVSRESMEMLEKLFVKELTPDAGGKKAGGAGGAAGAAKGKGAADDAKKKPQLVVLIDMKKSQNIAITLARVKLGFPELKREILAMNPTVLSTAQLQSLMDMWPDRTEQQAIDSFHGDMNLLGTTEKFLVETRTVPRFKEKLACLVFKQEFPTRVHELRESIKLIIRGVNQVCESQALRQLFIYILQMGNLLNFGTEQGQTRSVGGFSLNSLVKLSQTKAFVGGITFLHYVVQSIERDVPHLARFYDQISLTSKCSKVSLSVLLSEKKSLDDGLKMLQHEANIAVPADVADAELATSILKHFATEVEHELEALDELLNEMDASKAYFLEYFEEEETSEELDVLFGHIANFTDEYRREHKKFLEMQRQQRLKEQKLQAQAMRHSMSSPPRPPTAPNSSSSRQSRHSHHGHSHHERAHVERQAPAQSTASDDVASTRQARRLHHGLMEYRHHGLVEFHPPAESNAGGDARARNLQRSLSSSSSSQQSGKGSDSASTVTMTPTSPLTAAAARVLSATSSCA